MTATLEEQRAAQSLLGSSVSQHQDAPSKEARRESEGWVNRGRRRKGQRVALWAQPALGHLLATGGSAPAPLFARVLPNPGSANLTRKALLMGTVCPEVAGGTRACFRFLSRAPLRVLIRLPTLLGSLRPSTQITQRRQSPCSVHCREATDYDLMDERAGNLLVPRIRLWHSASPVPLYFLQGGGGRASDSGSCSRCCLRTGRPPAWPQPP